MIGLLSVASAACGGSDGWRAFESAGPYPVGNTRFRLTDEARARTLWIEVWYPAAESARPEAEKGRPVEDFLSDATDRATYANLLAAAPQPGPSVEHHSAQDGAPDPARAPWPLALFSHCMSCTRFSSFSLAERLASHGIVVAAPDHTGGTLFDSLRGEAAFLTPDFLDTREQDMHVLLDTLLTPASAQVPETLRGRFDARRVGIYGHSFGGATTGLALTRDSRYRAGLAIAVPMESPLLPGPLLEEIHVPVFFLLAVEDNMIFEIGNTYIRKNFEAAHPPAWKVEVTDAGHMSFSDFCKITENYTAGCGEGMRQTRQGEAFQYLDIQTGRAIGQAYVAAFFAAHLKDDADGRAYLDQAHPEGLVAIASKAQDGP
ncbi:MAG: prolyl oligopeptidase family serine peptidase [Nitrospirae bacterium]|nr:prolyl oligopeptidase family serine peptidase [Nitrospirota bacterium]